MESSAPDSSMSLVAAPQASPKPIASAGALMAWLELIHALCALEMAHGKAGRIGALLRSRMSLKAAVKELADLMEAVGLPDVPEIPSADWSAMLMRCRARMFRSLVEIAEGTQARGLLAFYAAVADRVAGHPPAPQGGNWPGEVEAEWKDATKEFRISCRIALAVNAIGSSAPASEVREIYDMLSPLGALDTDARIVSLANWLAQADGRRVAVGDDPQDWYNSACWHAIEGQNDRALEILAEQSLWLGDFIGEDRLEWALIDPDFAGMRKSEEFRTLLAKWFNSPYSSIRSKSKFLYDAAVFVYRGPQDDTASAESYSRMVRIFEHALTSMNRLTVLQLAKTGSGTAELPSEGQRDARASIEQLRGSMDLLVVHLGPGELSEEEPPAAVRLFLEQREAEKCGWLRKVIVATPQQTAKPRWADFQLKSAYDLDFKAWDVRFSAQSTEARTAASSLKVEEVSKYATASWGIRCTGLVDRTESKGTVDEVKDASAESALVEVEVDARGHFKIGNREYEEGTAWVLANQLSESVGDEADKRVMEWFSSFQGGLDKHFHSERVPPAEFVRLTLSESVANEVLGPKSEGAE
jgi:hypothetical protein